MGYTFSRRWSRLIDNILELLNYIREHVSTQVRNKDCNDNENPDM